MRRREVKDGVTLATCRRLLMLRDGKRVLREGGGERGGEDAVALGGERRPRGRGVRGKCEEAMREVLGAGRGVQAGEVEAPAMAAEA